MDPWIGSRSGWVIFNHDHTVRPCESPPPTALDCTSVCAHGHRCVAMALAAYPNLATLKLQELNVYDEAVSQLARWVGSCDRVL